MAFRVLKTYPSQSKIAAKKLRTYPDYDTLAPGSSFRAFEKIGDVGPAVAPTSEDLKDIQELESPPVEENPPPPPADNGDLQPEPAAPVEPPPPAAVPATEFESDDGDLEIHDEDAEEGIETTYPNQFSMEAGFLPNSAAPGPALKFGGGLRYGRNLDSAWAIEGATFYYKSGDTDLGVTLTILTLIGTVRWQTKLSANWDFFLYGGLLYPYVASQVGATKAILSDVQSVSPALGAGLLLQTGPNWYMRFNLGTDAMTLGVMLRY
jgi:hypothetical protein